MTDDEIQEIIEVCRVIAANQGVIIPTIMIDRSDIAQAISSGTAVAVLTNEKSEKHASMIAKQRKEDAPKWVSGRVMAISGTIIKASANSMFAIGVIVHEVGHAYNIAAGITNTEANAQVFEIETLLKLSQEKDKIQTLDEFLKKRVDSAYLANTPATGGYERLHKTIQSLPETFKETLGSYYEKLPKHIASHQNSSSKFFYGTLKELEIPPSATAFAVSSSTPKKKLLTTVEPTDFFNAQKAKSVSSSFPASSIDNNGLR